MPTPRKYKSDAERVKAFRERNNKKTLCVQIDAQLMEKLDEFLKFKDITKNKLIEKLLTTQLLRKR